MKIICSLVPAWRPALAVCSMLWCVPWLSQGQTVTQSLTLKPGWNSVYLEVQPPDPAISRVFADPAIESVWEPKVRVSTVAFIRNQNEAPFNRGGWAVYVPTNRPESLNNDLFSVRANHAYLLNVTGNSPVSLNVSGTPSLESLPFEPDAFTLRGFAVDPNAPPTFRTFFSGSPAHYQATSGVLQRMYRLNNATAQWELVSPGDLINRGEAYWVHTLGSSSFMGPLSVKPLVGNSLNFGLTATEQDLSLENTTDAGLSVTLTDMGTGGPVTYYANSPGNPLRSWLALPQNYTFTLAPRTTTRLRLGVQRSQMAADTFGTVLAITDGLGSQQRVALTAQRPAIAGGKTAQLRYASSGGAGARIGAEAIPVALQAGLWVGDVTVDAVAETYNNVTNTTPVRAPFDLRVILHVNTNGVTRFLREVIEMYQNGTYTTNTDGQRTVSQPGQTVLLTDDNQLALYTGVALRDGTPVGRRISTAGFDFDPPGGTNFLTMSGSFGVGNTIRCGITLTPQSPTNPFLHRYHPDHDGLDDLRQPIASTNKVQEVYTISRQLEFQFTADDPTGQTASDYGYNEIGGIYRETLTGLHRNPLVTSGTFRLRRVVNTPALNQNM